MDYWSVVTFDKEKAEKIFNDVIASRTSRIIRQSKNSVYEYVDFEDGVRLIRLRPTENARGYRHTKLWIDKNTPHDIAYEVFLPKFIGNENDIVWI